MGWQGEFISSRHYYSMGLPVRPGHQSTRITVESSGPRWAPGLNGVLNTLIGRESLDSWGPLSRRQRALVGCFVKGAQPYTGCVFHLCRDVGFRGYGQHAMWRRKEVHA